MLGRLILRSTTTPSSSSAIRDYCQLVQQSIDSQKFVSLHLRGPSKKAGTKEELRGCLSQVQGRLVASSGGGGGGAYLQVTLKYHSATDIVKNWKQQQQAIPGEMLQELLEATHDSTMYKSEWGTWHASGTTLGLQHCTLTTTTEIIELDLEKSKIKTKQISAAGRQQDSQPLMTTIIANHDRAKQVPVSEDAPFWKAIGLDKKNAKRRQCQKFVEIVANLVSNYEASNKRNSISTIDMGCGRGYLTFSVHYYLQQHLDHVTTRGIDMRPKLVEEMNAIASQMEMNGLSFETGTIDSFLETNTVSSETQSTVDTTHDLNLLIALHACDTATDDAIWSGIQSQAHIIVVAPCCHKQIRPQLDAMVGNSRSSQHPYLDVLRHGIYRERMAETVTDSMRALLLELAHYQVKVFEFIGGEHTSKNVMITAVKRERLRNGKELEDLRERLKDLARVNGIQEQRLATWLKEDLGGQVVITPRLSSKAMPPL
jgi:Methyltransferase domain